MNNQLSQLKRENQDLKDLLFDLAPIIGKCATDFGMIDKELHAKVKSIATGVKYNPLDWDESDKNGEQ